MVGDLAKTLFEFEGFKAEELSRVVERIVEALCVGSSTKR